MRDKRKDEAYWEAAKADHDARIRYLSEGLAEDQAEQFPSASIAASSLLRVRFQACLLRYSMGDPIDEIAEDVTGLLCDWLPDQLSKHPPGSKMGMERPGFSQMARYLSAIILSAPKPDKAAAAVKAYEVYDYTGPPVPGQVDRIWEAMADYLVPGREGFAASGINWPDAYNDLWLAIAKETPDEERPRRLSDFLNGWYDKMASEMAAETNTIKQKAPNYVGYWCLEAAAASVMAGIDDASFRDHEHYPANWADWARGARS